MCLYILPALEGVWNVQDSYKVHVAAAAGISPMCPQNPISMLSSPTPGRGRRHYIFVIGLSAGFQNPPAHVHRVDWKCLGINYPYHYPETVPTQWLTGMGV